MGVNFRKIDKVGHQCVRRSRREAAILYEKSLNLKTISQGDFGHFRENNQIILSKVAKIALKIVFKLKLFPYKIVVTATWMA